MGASVSSARTASRHAKVVFTLSLMEALRAGFKYLMVLSRLVWPIHACMVRDVASLGANGLG
jgi:hypothetical protein